MPIRYDRGQTARLRYDPMRQRYRPIPAALLMGSRYNQMGFGGYLGSNGTDTGSNSRVGTRNETGATVTKLRAYFANWFANSTNEQDGYNTITVKAALEYPAGTFTPLLFGGAASAAIAAGALLESDELTGLSVPAGATHWVRTWVTVTSGGKWPTGYLQNTLLGEAFDSGTGTSDLTGGGTIVQTAGVRGYGPVAVKATGFGGVPVKVAVAGVGDSIMMGSTDVIDAAGYGNVGGFGKGAAGNCPFLNLGIAGTAASNQPGATFARRLNLLSKAGLTDVILEWGVNDLAGGRTAAQIDGDLATIATAVAGLGQGIAVTLSTLTPRTANAAAAISSLTASGTLCTATVASTAGLATGQRLTIAGATPAAYNGTVPIIVTGATGFTYVASSAPGTSPATGSPTATDGFQSQAQQTAYATPAGAYTGGTASIRSQRNAAVRVGRPYAADVLDIADAVETGRDTGLWKAGFDGAAGPHLFGPLSGTAQAGSTTLVVKTGQAMTAGVWYAGQLTFTGGANAGLQRAVNTNAANGDVTLSSAFPAAPAAGDAFTLAPYLMSAAGDGQHPAANSTVVPGNGGVYLVKDAVAAKIGAWLAQ